MPFADGLKKWLLELQLGSVPKAKPMLLMEPVAEIRERILARFA